MIPIHVVVKKVIKIVTNYDDTSINHYIVGVRYYKRTITTVQHVEQELLTLA